MKIVLIVIFLLTNIFSYSQNQKRLALVIGNAKYEKGELKNPVNDALLVAKTLQELNFEVILDTNITSRSKFLGVIKQFGNLRDEFEVGFVYYAGHGVQVGSQNYLLPTNELFGDEMDVEDNAVSVQAIMRHLMKMSNQVNVLILDACRDNPFEKNWQNTRSIKGSGLAKMTPPNGTLIAFSTTAGNTSPDGDNENSIYTTSLVKNMKIEGISLDQVFRNVRSEVYELTNGIQQTEESTQLTGEAFYLVKSNYSESFRLIDSLNKAQEYIKSLTLINNILNDDADNIRAVRERGFIHEKLEMFNDAILDYNKAILLNPYDVNSLNYKGTYLMVFERFNEAIELFNNVIKIDSNFWKAYFNKSLCLYDLGKYEQAIQTLTIGINNIPNNPDLYSERARYYMILEDYNSALIDYSKAIEVAQDKSDYYTHRADLYADYLNETEKALDDYDMAISLDPENTWTLINKAARIADAESIELYNKVIKIDSTEPLGYYNKAACLYNLGKYEQSIQTLTVGINNIPDNPDLYSERAAFHIFLEDYNSALIDYSKAIEVAQDKSDYYTRRADLYHDYLDETDKALDDYDMAISLDPENTKPLINKAYLLDRIEQSNEAIELYNKIIKIDSTEPLGYSNKAACLYNLGKYEQSIQTLTIGINNIPNNPNLYSERAAYHKVLEDYNSALIDYSKAIEVAQDKSDFYTRRADLYADYLNETEKALDDYDMAISLDPENTWTLINKAARIVDPERSIELYNKVIKIDSTEHLGYSNKAACLYILGKYEQAIQTLTIGINNIPNNPDLYVRRAENHIILEDYNRALIDYTKAIEVAQDKSDYYTRRADLYDDYLDETDKALDDYGMAISLDPENTKPLINKAYLLDRIERSNEAIELYNKVIKIDSTEHLGYFYKADCLYNLGEYEQAIQILKKGIDLNPYMAKFYRDMANNYMRLNDTSNAISCFDVGIKFAKSKIDILNYGYEFMSKHKMFDNALVIINELLNLDQSSENYAIRGMLYTHLKKFELAQNDFIKSMKLDPDNRSPYYHRSKMYKMISDFENEKNDILTTIKMDPDDPEGYYYMAKIYLGNEEYFRSLSFLDKSINKLLSKKGYIISDESGFENVEISQLYIMKAEIYKQVNAIDLACEEYKKACDNGNCIPLKEYCSK